MGHRRNWLPHAIRCYQEQTYQRRELLILSDGPSVADLVPSDPEIRHFHLGTKMSVGGKRNFANQHADGVVICHWDDDDYSEPNRIAEQVGDLHRSGCSVVGFSSMRFMDEAAGSWWLYTGPARYALGTSLCYRRDWWQEHKFESLNIGEDAAFVERAANRAQLFVRPAGELMYATIHPNNTSPRRMEQDPKRWKRL